MPTCPIDAFFSDDNSTGEAPDVLACKLGTLDIVCTSDVITIDGAADVTPCVFVEFMFDDDCVTDFKPSFNAVVGLTGELTINWFDFIAIVNSDSASAHPGVGA